MLKKIIAIDEIFFLKIYDYGQKNFIIYKLFKNFTTLSKDLFIIFYSYTLLYTFMKKNFTTFIFLIFVPMFTLIISLLLRFLLKRKRPYLIFKLKNLPSKNKYSYPSNHSASSLIIGLSCLSVNLYFGIFVILLSLIAGVSRIFSGIHFPLDVLCGYLIAIIIYLVCYNIYFLY